MGNRSSRHRPSTTSNTQPDAAQAGPAPASVTYAPSPVYSNQAQQPYYPHPQQQPYSNNGQYYGGWREPNGRTHPTFSRHEPQAQELTQTATIRNAVNLKKSTLQVVPLQSDPSKLAISFVFDASAPCSVSMFAMATEEPSKGCKLTPTKQPPAPAVRFKKGLGLRFPSPGGDPLLPQQHIIDLGMYSEAALLQHEKDTYPLVIRLETVADKGLKDGHTLEELVPGAEQKVWVQSQTTFAILSKEEDGEWTVRVVKQKIWVDGVSYELQEIYGLEHSGAKVEAAASLEDSEERLCVICLVNERDSTVLPCRHMCMCHECAQELRKQTSKCPICRNHVESLLHIKMSKRGPKQGQAAAAAAPATAAAAVAEV